MQNEKQNDPRYAITPDELVIDVQSATKGIKELREGSRKHENIYYAIEYAIAYEDRETLTLLRSKRAEMQALLVELAQKHIQSGGTLYPGVPTETEGLATAALFAQALKDPGNDIGLLKVAELDNHKYLVGACKTIN